MSKLLIKRIKYSDDSTIGVFSYEDLEGCTLELPWVDNQTSISCIPEGVYTIEKIVSPSLGNCFNVRDVKGRSYIRIHAGNYTRQIEGCILVGDNHADIDSDGITDVTNSKATLNKLLDRLPQVCEMEIYSA